MSALFVFLHFAMDRAPLQDSGGGAGKSWLRSLQGLEGRATDLKFRLRGVRPPHPDVLVAVVDEAGVQSYGRWPWPRSLIANALEALTGAGAAAVGMDMVFTDKAPDTLSQSYKVALFALDNGVNHNEFARDPVLQRYRHTLLDGMHLIHESPDGQLAESFRRAPQIVQGIVAYSDRDQQDFTLREPEFVRLLAPHMLTQLPGRAPGSFFEVPWPHVGSLAFHSAQTPLPELAAASPRWGHFNVSPDPDGTIRRLPLFVKLSNPPGLLPSLALQTAAAGSRLKSRPSGIPRWNGWWRLGSPLHSPNAMFR